MLVPIEWLKDYVKFDLETQALADLFTMAGLEVEAIEESEVGGVLNVTVTPNRGDCLSIVGLAREVIAKLGEDCQPTALWQEFQNGFGSRQAENGGETAKRTSVTIEDAALCPRYAARLLENVRVEASPEKCQKRLEAAGMRPINNIVDVTNYVLLELGQPLHAFDQEMLIEGRIVVRQVGEGEKITTLDGVERELKPPMLAICDAQKPVAVAGVMGGAESEVTERTRTILLESAHFAPLSIRRTKRLLGLNSEAAYRFERYVDPELVLTAAYRACQLLKEWHGFEAVPGVIDVYPTLAQPRHIELRVERAQRLLGMPVTGEQAKLFLTRLGFEVSGENGTLQVTVPTFRYDLRREEDLIEEVGRIYGYENIPETPLMGVTTQGKQSNESAFADRLRGALLRCGLVEMINHSMGTTSPLDTPGVEPVPLFNPMSSDYNFLRPSLLPNLMESVMRNARRGNQDLSVFEIGHLFSKVEDGYKEKFGLALVMTGVAQPPHWGMGRNPREIDFFDAKGVIEEMLSAVGLKDQEFHPCDNDPRFHPGRCVRVWAHDTEVGVLGELLPDLQERYDLPRRAYLAEFDFPELMRLASYTPRFKPLPRYPAVRRDIAFLIDRATPWQQIAENVQEACGSMLEEARLFDIYTGANIPPDKHSLAVSLVLRKPDGTLTDEEINSAVHSVLTRLQEELGASQR